MDNPFPNHVAIIPDGNCRWATARGQSPVGGYKAGVQTLKAIVARAQDIGIPFITTYAVSAENLRRRSSRWCSEFFTFISKTLRHSWEDPLLRDVRLRLIGDLSLFPLTLRKELNNFVENTKTNTGLTLTLALGYTGQEEILDAVNALLQERFRAGSSTPVTASEFETYLDFEGIPSPDLLIRTSGEMRLSGFLLWHLAYSELAFVPELWPDLTVERFDAILEDYQKRHRNFGAERTEHAA